MIKELLEQLQTKYKDKATTGTSVTQLANTSETWSRIATLDSFSEFNFADDSEKEAFLKDWIENNPYSAIN